MKLSREFVLFVALGAIAALVNWLSRIGFSMFLPLSVAIVAAYLVGFVTAFTLFRRYVFGPSERGMGSEYARFALVNVVALIQVWIVTMTLVTYVFPYIGFTWRVDEVAHAIGIASPLATSYLGHRHFSFARGKQADG